MGSGGRVGGGEKVSRKVIEKGCRKGSEKGR